VSKYLKFEDDGTVLNKKHKTVLGTIDFYVPWNQYVFAPMSDAIFNDECLKDIIYVIQTKNKQSQNASK